VPFAEGPLPLKYIPLTNCGGDFRQNVAPLDEREASCHVLLDDNPCRNNFAMPGAYRMNPGSEDRR